MKQINIMNSYTWFNNMCIFGSDSDDMITEYLLIDTSLTNPNELKCEKYDESNSFTGNQLLSISIPEKHDIIKYHRSVRSTNKYNYETIKVCRYIDGTETVIVYVFDNIVAKGEESIENRNINKIIKSFCVTHDLIIDPNYLSYNPYFDDPDIFEIKCKDGFDKKVEELFSIKLKSYERYDTLYIVDEVDAGDYITASNYYSLRKENNHDDFYHYVSIIDVGAPYFLHSEILWISFEDGIKTINYSHEIKYLSQTDTTIVFYDKISEPFDMENMLEFKIKKKYLNEQANHVINDVIYHDNYADILWYDGREVDDC